MAHESLESSITKLEFSLIDNWVQSNLGVNQFFTLLHTDVPLGPI